MNRYFQEVLDSHELILEWLSTPDAPQETYDTLLSRFSPAFSMVTTGGSQLNYRTLASFFSAQSGTKAGLTINIDDLALIAESAMGATVSYQEQQQRPGQTATTRFSTAVFELGAENNVIWRHLQETALPLKNDIES